MLAALDELTLRCPDVPARSHIREAIKSYEAGAYRAAIVLTYVAVCFDLIEKLRALASAGDAEAKLQVQALEANQAKQAAGDKAGTDGLLAFERSLIANFKDKFGFFGFNEHEEIARLQRDRNRCAHPTFYVSSEPYQPTAELARLHIRNALELVLLQEPKQGRAALAELSKIVTGPYFPRDHDESVERLRSSPIKAARESLVRAFIDDMMFGMTEKDSVYYNKGIVVYALGATLELHRSIAEPRALRNADKLLLSADDLGIKIGAAVGLRYPEIGEQLSSAAKSVLKAWLAEPITVKANALARASAISWLTDTVATEIRNLTSADLRKLTVKPTSDIVERVVTLICEANTWLAMEKVVKDCGVSMAHLFTRDQIRQIARSLAVDHFHIIGSPDVGKILEVIAADNEVGKDGLRSILEEEGVDLDSIVADLSSPTNTEPVEADAGV